MQSIKEKVRSFLKKYGYIIASCAFIFVTFSANSPCLLPFYEPEEPEGLDRFKKFSK